MAPKTKSATAEQVAKGKKITLAQARANMAAHPDVPPVSKDWIPPMPKRKMRAVSRDLTPLHRFEQAGDSVEGTLNALRPTSTTNGPAVIADLVADGGENISFFRSAGMGDLTDDLLGLYVRVTYLGPRENPRTRRTFKAFQIEAEDVEVEEAENDEIPF